ncbi:SulP family inorganic anion transporter [Geomesophilobacter sediminis]|uniref:SulP family inorganic anion transporter n=1 Tax=Geomesophilobacter sediminis TaxID=2798584 RepID=A0A8J7M194_9BACT|nr:SulP family inorganic anion transporter [Geomesophilobacter sediminis]MBJ6726810.1 SulP family inorganic anion transporter [Geomesophilobacter sediminis]
MATAPKVSFRLPFLQGILPVDRSQVRADIVAGVTLAALAIPEVMGYTKISETPVVTGLYTILIPMILYALFGASRHLVVGADSATAAILAGSLTGMATPGSTEWLALSGTLALLTAAFLFLASLARLGFLADFLSRTVLVGFFTGVGIQVCAGEISGMLGLPGGGHGTIRHLIADTQNIGQASPADFAISVAVLVIVVGSRKFSKMIPGALIAVVGAIIATWVFNLESKGVHVLGLIPSGLPRIGLPETIGSWALLRKLLPTAFMMFVVVLAQSAATSRAYATRENEDFDQNVDLMGLCLANVGAGLSGTFVVNGSPTKTQMVESAGGRSQLSQLTTGLLVLMVLLFLTGPLAYLPTAALSTIVFLIGVELIDAKGMRRIFAARPWEFWVALTTALSVVFAGVEQSILLAIVLSLMVHTRHGYLMNNMILVRDEKNGLRQQKVTAPEQVQPGLMIYRFMHSMYYANAHVLTGEVMELARGATPALVWFCIDAAAVDDVDFTAAESLRDLYGSLAEAGVRLVFCELIDEVQAEFDRSQLTDLLGRDAFFPTPAAVVAAYGLRATDEISAPHGGSK